MLKWNYTYISSITNDEFTRYYLSNMKNGNGLSSGIAHFVADICFSLIGFKPMSIH